MKNKNSYLKCLFACTMIIFLVFGFICYAAEKSTTSSTLEVAKGERRVVEKTMSLQSLTIGEGASLVAPEGKYLTMTVYGIGKQIKPGAYMGDIVISVTDNYLGPPGGFEKIRRNLHTAILIDDGKVVHEKSTPAVVYGGEITDSRTEGIYIASEEESFNGIVIDGDTEYTINNVKMNLDGLGDNDFIGVGSAVAAYGNARVTINDSEFNVNGVTRCAVHVGGDSVVTLNNCTLSNHSLENLKLKGEDMFWQVDFSGFNRLTQLCDNGTVYYNNCRLKSNGWGLCSIDSAQIVKLYVKDSTLELNGPNGYGTFCYANNPVTFDHSTINVNGYPMFIMGKQGTANIINGCLIKGRRFGLLCCSDDNSIVTIKDSTFQTDKSTLCIKGSATTINIGNTVMNAKNGVIVQLMDGEDTGDCIEYKIPVGVVDTAVPGRDLTNVSPTEDVKINIADSDIRGDFFNSTTDIRAYKNSVRSPKDMSSAAPPEGAAPQDAPPGMMAGIAKDLQGPKNLGLNFTNVRLKGIISSATQVYKKGLTSIVPKTKHELSNVTQTAAETVNNGVIVSFDKDCVWTVSGTSYLTSLTVAEGAVIKAPGSKKLTMTIDGVQTPVKAGTYKGKIVIKVS